MLDDSSTPMMNGLIYPPRKVVDDIDGIAVISTSPIETSLHEAAHLIELLF